MAPEDAPLLLLPGNASPHTFQLRPSDATALNEAQIIIWVGPDLETFLVRPLQNLPKQPLIISLMDIPGLTRYPVRGGEEWHTCDHGHEHGHDHSHHNQNGWDPHIWLDPDNAIIVIRYLSEIFMELDPAHAADYTQRATKAIVEIEQLKTVLKTQLAPAHEKPFFVLHDAFQYLEQRYDLHAVRAIYAAPHNSPSVAHMHALRDSLYAHKVECVFKEPQLPASFIAPLIDGFPIKIGTLDPLGATIPAGPEAYPTLMRNLARDFTDCFAKNK